MRQNGDASAPPRGLILLAVVLALLTFALVSAAHAQEPTTEPTPVATAESGEATPTGPAPTATPDLSIRTVVRIEVDPGPFESGQEFEARVMVDNVDHLESFQFAISYDPKRVQPVKAGDAEQTPGSTPAFTVSGNPVKTDGVGDIFGSSPRSEVLVCAPAGEQNNSVTVTCVTRAPPVCLGGPEGASGSGLLGTVFFKSKGGGPTTLTLSTSQLLLDDYLDCTVEVQGTTGALPNDCLPIRVEANDTSEQVSCQPDGTSARVTGVEGNIQERAFVQLEGLGWAATDFLQPTGEVPTIPNRQQNAEVLLTGGGGGSRMLLLIIIGVVVIVALAGGAGAYLVFRRRQSGGA